MRILRLIFAAFFALVLFAEWGSHAVILAHHYDGSNGSAVAGSERDHEDPCRTLICSDGQRRDQGFKFSHESSQHNVFFGRLAGSSVRAGVRSDRLAHPSLVFGISRPPDPAFHPPEIS